MFKYFYGTEADQFNFIRVPRALLTENRFADLSLQAKLLYGVLLDRMCLSVKNNWYDEENRVYIIYQITEIMENLGLSKNRAMSYLSELENFGLVEKKKRGHGLPNLLYIKNFVADEKSEERTPEQPVETVENFETRSEADLTSDSIKGSDRTDLMKSEKPTQEVPDSTLLYSYTEYSKTDKNYTNLILSENSGYDEMLETVLENIEYNYLTETNPLDTALIDSIAQAITEVMLTNSKEMTVAGSVYPTELVQKRLMSLDSSHIEYVIECLHNTSTKMRNMKKYLLTMLFNAPVTIDAYYTNRVNCDMREGA